MPPDSEHSQMPTRTGDGDAELRAARRERVFGAMAERGIDVLVLGRRASVAYATGARGLWTAGTRPFGAVGVLVTGRRTVHLLSTWDAGVPPEVPFEHLYGITWNPAVMAESLRTIGGFAEARRIGVDALSPGFARAVRRLAPEAELVPADDLLQAVRAVKLPAELARIRASVAMARAGVEAATAALARGATTDHALAAALQAAAEQGATVPTSAPVVRYLDPSGTPVYVDLGFLVDGYEGGCGRTVGPGGDPSGTQIEAVVAVQRRVLDACHAGATVRDLRSAAAAAAAGAGWWMVRGSGMGFEAPVVTDHIGEGVVLQAGMVLSVEVALDGWRGRDLAVVGPDGAELA